MADITITAGGETPFSVDASSYGREYLHKILDGYEAATKCKPAYKTEMEIKLAQQRAQQEKEEARRAMEARAAREAEEKAARIKQEQNTQKININDNKGWGLGR